MTNLLGFLPHEETVSASPGSSLSTRVARVQDFVVRAIVETLVVLVLVMLVWVVCGVARDVFQAVVNPSTGSFRDLSVELLTVFVFLALGAVRTLAVVYSPSERAADLAEV